MEIERIKKMIRGEVDDSEATCAHYATDASLFTMRPEAVVFPKDIEDLKALVRFCADERGAGHGISVTARGGGSDMTGGSLSESLVVDFTAHFNRIKKIGSDYAVVEPGVFFRDFDKETRAHGLFLPSYPASRELCTVGGMVANNSGGEKTLAYGKTERYVRRLKVVLADGNEYEVKPLTREEFAKKEASGSFEGELYRRIRALIEKNYERIMQAKPDVSKNSSGYALWSVWDKERGIFDLTKLFVGSQGTLGLVSEIELALVRPKPHARLLVIFLRNLQPLAQVVGRVRAQKPESFESYDDHTFRVAVKFFPLILRRLRGNFLLLFFRFLPEIFAALAGGIPKLVLLAEFTGETEKEADEKARRAAANLSDFHLKTKITQSAAETEKYWTIRRESFNLLRHHTKNLRTAPFIDDIVVRPEHLPEFLPKLYAILDHFNLTYTIAGHAGDGNFHIIPLMDLHDPRTKVIIRELSEKIYALVKEFGGSPSGEHNDGLIRSPFLPFFFGDDVYRLFEEIKKICDPQGIFNPHKKVGVSVEYALAHIRE